MDAEVKEAAQGLTSETKYLPKTLPKNQSTPITLPISKLAVKQCGYVAMKQEAKEVFELSPRHSMIKKIHNSAPSNKFQKLIFELPHHHASLLMQLRTGHAPLNKHLTKIKVADSPMCPACEQREETVHHYILMCEEYRTQRDALRARTTARMLNLCALLNHPKHVPHLFHYIAETRRLDNNFGDVTLPEPKD